MKGRPCERAAQFVNPRQCGLVGQSDKVDTAADIPTAEGGAVPAPEKIFIRQAEQLPVFFGLIKAEEVHETNSYLSLARTANEYVSELARANACIDELLGGLRQIANADAELLRVIPKLPRTSDKVWIVVAFGGLGVRLSQHLVSP